MPSLRSIIVCIVGWFCWTVFVIPSDGRSSFAGQRHIVLFRVIAFMKWMLVTGVIHLSSYVCVCCYSKVMEGALDAIIPLIYIRYLPLISTSFVNTFVTLMSVKNIVWLFCYIHVRCTQVLIYLHFLFPLNANERLWAEMLPIAS